MLQRPKGTQDTLDTHRWQQLEQTAHRVLSQAGYHEIRTPLLEYTELFLRGVGESTDIVHKEMYRFTKGDRDLTLRPEGTAGVVRAYIENGLSRQPKPVRLFYTGPMFRYERPQAGRLRQFHQVGLEQFGLDTPASDLEALGLALSVLRSLGLTGLRLELNNLGTAADREHFKQRLKEQLAAHRESLCDTCQTRFDSNPLRLLDCKTPSCQAFYQGEALANLLATEYASLESQAHFQQVTEALTRMGVAWRRNRQLVRGLDYYTGLVFEVVAVDGQLGAQNVVCGGGRYNGLVQQLGGPDTPAVGWAFGVERLLALINSSIAPSPDVYLISDQLMEAWQLADRLRQWGLVVQQDISGKRLDKQFQTAAKSGARWAMVFGDNEQATNTVIIKDLTTSQQQGYLMEELSREQFLNTLLAGRINDI